MQMQKNGMWIPLIASVGVGAATFYTMTKNNQGMGQTMQQMVPFISQMGGNQSQSSGNAGKQMGGNQSQNQSGGNSGGSQQLGPFGMS